MVQRSEEVGAHAVVNLRCIASMVASGAARKKLTYSTAVMIEQKS